MAPRFTRVQQRHDLGCGVAVTATITGLSYTRVLRDLFPTPTYRGGRLQVAVTSTRIVTALKRYGIPAYIARPRRLPTRPAVLFFDWQPKIDGVTGYHAVVKDKYGRFLDPNWTSCTPEFYELRWFQSGRETIILGSP